MLAPTIRHHLERCDSPVAKEIQNNIYVDNVLLTADTRDEAIEKYHETKTLFRDMSINIREFCSNDGSVNDELGGDIAKDVKTVKVLLITWKPASDTYEIQSPKVCDMG